MLSFKCFLVFCLFGFGGFFAHLFFHVDFRICRAGPLDLPRVRTSEHAPGTQRRVHLIGGCPRASFSVRPRPADGIHTGSAAQGAGLWIRPKLSLEGWCVPQEPPRWRTLSIGIIICMWEGRRSWPSCEVLQAQVWAFLLTHTWVESAWCCRTGWRGPVARADRQH